MAQSTARKLNQPYRDEQQRQYEVLIGRKRHRRLNAIRSGSFLALSFCILALAITYYLSLQSDITSMVKDISKMESTLNQMKMENDETYSRINSNVNIEEVRRVAIQELGMKYADEGQIVSFNGDGSDYVRQTGEIPSSGK